MSHQQPRPSVDGRTSGGPGILPQLPRPSPSMTPQISPYQAQSISPAPQYLRQNSFQQTPATAHRTVTPQTPTQPLPYAASQQLHHIPALGAAHLPNYASNTAPVQPYGRPPVHPTQSYTPYGGPMAPPTREPDVFVLPDIANDSIPKSIRDQFPQDPQGRVLFFTRPPVLSDQAIYDRNDREKKKPLAHSERYLAAKAARDELIASRKRANANEQVTSDRKRAKGHAINGHGETNGCHSQSTNSAGLQDDDGRQGAKSTKSDIELTTTNVIGAMQKWIQNMNEQTVNDYKASYGDRWEEVLKEDGLRQQERTKKTAEKQKAREEILAKCSNSPNHITNFHRDIWGSGFKGERY